MATKTLDLGSEVVQALRGKKCWYVSCGRSAASTFELALGEKIPRRQLLHNEAHSLEFQQFEGEANLLVWCTWRLDESSGPISSSDDATERIGAA